MSKVKVMVEVNIDIVEKVIENFFLKMRTKQIDHFKFSSDLYWSVPNESFTDLTQTPELDVGSLTDDISFLTSLVEENYDANFLELERLSALFKAFSCEMDKKV